jgi:putative ABC transport system permease protein
VRSRTEFAGLASSIRAAARELHPGVAVQVTRLEANLDLWRSVSKLIATISGSLTLLALILASVGVYGVVSYVVSRRRREVGIRMALGAEARDVEHLILRQTMGPVAFGVLLGLAAAAVASRVLQSVLFGVSPFDPLAFIGAPLVLLAIAVTAALLPTRAALRIDPIATLRYE